MKISHKLKIILFIAVCFAIVTVVIQVSTQSSKVEDCTSRLFIVSEIRNDNRVYGAVDIRGRVVIPLIYNDIKGNIYNIRTIDRNLPIPAASLEDKYGFLSGSGEWLIKPQFDFVQSFTGPVAIARTSDGEHLIDTSGKKISNTYASIAASSIGIHVAIKNNEVSYLDNEGTVIQRFKNINKIEHPTPQTGMAENFEFKQNGYAPYFTGGKYGLINDRGSIVLEAEYDSISIFNNFLGVGKYNKYMLTKLNGKPLLKTSYEHIMCDKFDATVCILYDGFDYKIFDTNRKVVLTEAYTKLPECSNSKCIIYDDTRELYYAINLDNKLKIQLPTDTNTDYRPFHNGYARIRRRSYIGKKLELKYGFIDQEGDVAIPITYGPALDFECGLASLLLDKDELLIDTQNMPVWKSETIE